VSAHTHILSLEGLRMSGRKRRMRRMKSDRPSERSLAKLESDVQRPSAVTGFKRAALTIGPTAATTSEYCYWAFIYKLHPPHTVWQLTRETDRRYHMTVSGKCKFKRRMTNDRTVLCEWKCPVKITPAINYRICNSPSGLGQS
jgi:hypothetical protein